MNEQTLWTFGTTIVVAFFTTVVVQFVFAPSLEARKQTLLNRSKVASDTADTIRAMQFQLVNAHMKMFDLGDRYNYQSHGAVLDELIEGFNAADALKHAGLKERYVVAACCAQYAVEIFTMVDDHEESEYKQLIGLLDDAAQAIDPVKLPWVKYRHSVRAYRRYTTETEQREDVNADG